MIYKLDGISKYYSTETGINLGLDGVNVSFTKGEIVGISGSSGSGKSTLVNILSGLLDADEGTFIYKNENITKLSVIEKKELIYRNISYINQSHEILKEVSVKDNIVLVLRTSNCKKSLINDKADELLKLVMLDEHKRKKAKYLSGGEKQRLAIARELAKDSDVIIADEPTSNLDSKTSMIIISIFKKIAAEKLLLIVSHDLSELKEIMTRKIVLNDGQIIEDVCIRNNSRIKSDIAIQKHRNGIILFLLWINLKSRKFHYLAYSLLILGIMVLMLIPTIFKESLERNNAIDTHQFRYFDENSTLTLADLYIQREKFPKERLFFPITNTIISSSNKNEIPLQLSKSQVFGLEDKPYQIDTTGKLLEKDLIKGRLPVSEYEIIVNEVADTYIGNKIVITVGGVSTNFIIVGMTNEKYFNNKIYISEYFFFHYDGSFNYQNLSKIISLMDGNFTLQEKTKDELIIPTELTDSKECTLYLSIDLYVKHIEKKIDFNLMITHFLKQAIVPMKIDVFKILIDSKLANNEAKCSIPKSYILNADEEEYFILNKYYYYTGSSQYDKERLIKTLISNKFYVNDISKVSEKNDIESTFNSILKIFTILIAFIIAFSFGKGISNYNKESFLILDKMNIRLKTSFITELICVVIFLLFGLFCGIASSLLIDRIFLFDIDILNLSVIAVVFMCVIILMYYRYTYLKVKK